MTEQGKYMDYIQNFYFEERILEERILSNFDLLGIEEKI